MSDLITKHCAVCEGGTTPLDTEQTAGLLEQVPDWALAEDTQQISRRFQFQNFHQTMAFVNALAWIAHSEEHHPDLEVSYATCIVRYSTHSISGLSENDFICAAKINALLD